MQNSKAFEAYKMEGFQMMNLWYLQILYVWTLQSRKCQKFLKTVEAFLKKQKLVKSWNSYNNVPFSWIGINYVKADFQLHAKWCRHELFPSNVVFAKQVIGLHIVLLCKLLVRFLAFNYRTWEFMTGILKRVMCKVYYLQKWSDIMWGLLFCRL